MTDITRRTAVKYAALCCALPLVGSLAGCASKDEGEALSDVGNVSDRGSAYSGAVSTNASLATDVGKSVLEAGGNAVDAAVAISFALGVVQPYGSGLGGGGGMLIYSIPDGTNTFIDYRVAAPLSRSKKQGKCCVPGLAKGMEFAHSRYGSLPWADVVSPSYRLALDGFKVDTSLASYLSQYQGYLQNIEGYTADGEVLGKGDTLKQPALAAVLKAIGDKGASAFYSGSYGSALASAIGCTEDDLSRYEAEQRDCLVQDCLGVEFVTAPAPFSGAAVVSLLQGMECLGGPSASDDPQGYLDALCSASSLSNQLRALYIADPDYTKDVNLEDLVSAESVSSFLKKGISVPSGAVEPESDTTSSYAVMDASGMLVVVTNTLGEFFGTGEAWEGCFLNNGMDSFSSTGVNSYEAGKRPRTYTAPTVINGGSYVFGAGSPGGTRIPRIMSQVLYSIVRDRLPVQEAVDLNRVLYLENTTFALEREGNREDLVDFSDVKGYSAVRGTTKTYFGAVQIVGYDSGSGTFAINDTRRAGSAEVVG